METGGRRPQLGVLERAVFMMDLDGANVGETDLHPLSPLNHVQLLKGVSHARLDNSANLSAAAKQVPFSGPEEQADAKLPNVGLPRTPSRRRRSRTAPASGRNADDERLRFTVWIETRAVLLNKFKVRT